MITISKPDYSHLKKGGIYLFCGFPKTGKTTAISTFGDRGSKSVLVLDIDDGTDHINDVNRIKVYSLLPPLKELENGDWEIIPPLERGILDNDGKPTEAWSYIEAIDYIKENWHTLGYDSIAIDTVDAFLNWINDYMVQYLKEKDAMTNNPKYTDATDIGDFEYAAGYVAARNKVVEKIVELVNIVRNTGFVLLSTHMNKTISIRDGGKVIAQKLPLLPEKLAAWIGGKAEMICLISKNEKGQHLCSFDGYGETMIGSRPDPIVGKTLIFKKDKGSTLYEQIMKELKGE